MKKYLKAIPLLFLFSCDIQNDDVKPEIQDFGTFDIYTVEDSETIADLEALLGENYSENIELSVSPTAGNAEILCDNQFLQYTPTGALQSDQTVISVVNDVSETIGFATLNVNPKNDGCTFGGQSDYITIKLGETGTLNITENDGICFNEELGGSVAIFDWTCNSEEFEFWDIIDVSRDSDTEDHILAITPITTGRLQFIYSVCYGLAGSAGKNGGTLSSSDLPHRASEVCDFYGTGLVTIDVIAD